MAKFHLVAGEPKRCIAGPGRCKYKLDDGSEPPHYATKEDARESYEQSNAAETLTLPLSKRPGPVGYDDIGRSGDTEPTLELIRETMLPSVLEELRDSENGNVKSFLRDYDDYQAGKLAPDQFANWASINAQTAVERISREIRETEKSQGSGALSGVCEGADCHR